MNRNQRRLVKSQSTSQKMLEDANKLHQRGSFIEAERLYKRVLVEDPRCSDAYHLLGVIYIQTGKAQNAVELIQQAIHLKQNTAVYHSNLAIAFQGLGKFDDAAQQFKIATFLKPDYFEGYDALGHIYHEKGEHAEAIKCYEQSLIINPTYSKGFNNIGVVFQGLGNFAQAIQNYKHAISLNSNYVEAYNNLGSALQEQELFEEAKEAYLKALSIEGNNPAVYYNLGKLYFKINDHSEAVKNLSHYLKLDPKDIYGASLLLAHLGEQALPARASDAQLQRLYTKRAQRWQNISDDIYKAPQLVANALHSFNTGNKIDILDAGCGTGVVGLLVKNIANKLDGIDISLPMLEQARKKQIYTELHECDLVTFMLNNSNAYDAITCSATLIHFGDLNPALHAASIALRKNGLFICTLFPNNNEQEISAATGVLMQGGGIYTHNVNYIKKVAAENNFNVELLETQIHEFHKDQPIEGLIVTLRKI